jgi:hypothetical protein
MKKSVVFLILGIVFLMPFISAETYSGFDRFKDNTKLFFSSGDKKVERALEIREKEFNSAIENIQNENEEDSIKNIERATKKLRIVQEKVSYDIAEEVKENIEGIKEKIEESKNLSENFEVYALEEEKTKLTAELVIEVEGKEGQTLKREVVKDETSGKKVVKIVVEYDDGTQEILEGGQIQNNVAQRVVEIQGQITQVQNQIAERVVKIEMAKQGEMQNKLEPEIKTDGDVNKKEDALPTPDLNAINPDLYDPNAGIPSNTIDGGEVTNIIEGGEGTEGTNEIGPAVESNEGDDESDSNEGDDASITGGVIRRILKKLG